MKSLTRFLVMFTFIVGISMSCSANATITEKSPTIDNIDDIGLSLEVADFNEVIFNHSDLNKINDLGFLENLIEVSNQSIYLDKPSGFKNQNFIKIKRFPNARDGLKCIV